MNDAVEFCINDAEEMPISYIKADLHIRVDAIAEATIVIVSHPNALSLRCILNCVGTNPNYVFAIIFIWGAT